MIQAQSASAVAPIRYGLRAMTAADLDSVRRWLAQPHVARWWPHPECALRSVTRHPSEPTIACLILTMNGRGVGYLQVYDPHHAPGRAGDGQTPRHPYQDRPRGPRGIDLFIGEASFIGQGHGPRFIRRGLDHLFDAGAPCVVADPNPSNVRSVAAFRSAGFRSMGERDTAWGHVLLMRCNSPRQVISP
jgi:aminoglycoside 6'-N-acetyltransferase